MCSVVPVSVDMGTGLVLFCKVNFSLSAAQDAGLYDVLTHAHQKLSNYEQEGKNTVLENYGRNACFHVQLFLCNVIHITDSERCKDVYVYNEDTCELPSRFKVEFLEHYHDTTSKVCQTLCSELEAERCFGIFYNVTHQICSLSSYTESSSTNDCRNKTGLLYFRRNLCLGEYNYFIFLPNAVLLSVEM